MNKRALRKLMQENNAKSPDILTVIVTATTQLDAYRIAGIFEETTGEELPFELESWQRSIRSLPVELYFVFQRKRHLMRFVQNIRKEFPEIKMIL